MSNSYLRLLLMSFLLIGLQVWVFTPMTLMRVATPMVYPVLLMFLPMDWKPIRLTIFGFVIGVLIDYFGFTPGLHAALFSLLAFIRYYLVKVITDAQDELDLLPLPSAIKQRSYILLAELLFIHHILLYALTSGLHTDWVYTALRFGAGYTLSFCMGLMIMLSLSVRLKPMKAHGK